MFRGSVKSTGYPIHSPVSPSLPLPCVTFCHHIAIGLYCLQIDVRTTDTRFTVTLRSCTVTVLSKNTSGKEREDSDLDSCQLTQFSRVFLEKLVVSQVVKIFPSLRGSRRFITISTTARRLSLSWADISGPLPRNLFFRIHFNIILSSTHQYSKWSRFFRYSDPNPVGKSLISSQLFWLDFPNKIC